jgi:hypothetical protein
MRASLSFPVRSRSRHVLRKPVIRRQKSGPCPSYGSKPVPGHGAVAIESPQKKRIRVEKMFKDDFSWF